VTAVKSKQPAVRRYPSLPRLTKEEGFTAHPFDIKNGVHTSGLIPGRFLKTGHRHDRHSTAYFGVAPSVFRTLVKRWQRTRPCASMEDFTFVDVGAGMGRAMLLAAEFPFRKVTGIELNPILLRIARKNLRLWRNTRRSRAPMQLICGDALDMRFPQGPTLVFLFNPFGESVMRRLLARLAESFSDHPGQLDLLYVNNEQELIFERQPGFTRLLLGQIRRSRADAIADHRIMANQPDGEYAATNYEDCSIWRFQAGSLPAVRKRKK
jgi:SAM-dependent methyltransferase